MKPEDASVDQQVASIEFVKQGFLFGPNFGIDTIYVLDR
jgi:hypothetical protein